VALLASWLYGGCYARYHQSVQQSLSVAAMLQGAVGLGILLYGVWVLSRAFAINAMPPSPTASTAPPVAILSGSTEFSPWPASSAWGPRASPSSGFGTMPGCRETGLREAGLSADDTTRHLQRHGGNLIPVASVSPE